MKKYNIPWNMAYAMALEACADDIAGGGGALLSIIEAANGTDDDIELIRVMRESVAVRLRERAARVRRRSPS